MISQRRNPLIADLFRRIEMVEAWGRGIPLILKFAPDADFREIGNMFIVSFPRPSFWELKSEKEGTTQETTPKTTQEKIVGALREEPTLTRRLIAQRLGISVDGVKYHLDKLKAAGKIRHVGPTKGGRWKVFDVKLDQPEDLSTGDED